MKQEWAGLNWYPDQLNMSDESKGGIPVLPDSSHTGLTFLDSSIFDNRDPFDTTEIFLRIAAVSRAVVPRTAIPINNSWSPGSSTYLLAPDQLSISKGRDLLDTVFVMEENNVLANLNIYNDQQVVDDVPTLISSTTTPFWS